MGDIREFSISVRQLPNFKGPFCWPNAKNIILWLNHILVPKEYNDTYYYLLRRYLESVCSNGCESRSAYLNLIGRLHDLDRLNNSHIQLFLEVDPQCVEPLLIEIFDLKPPSGAAGINARNPPPMSTSGDTE